VREETRQSICVYCGRPITPEERPAVAIQPDKQAHVECWAEHEKKQSVQLTERQQTAQHLALMKNLLDICSVATVDRSAFPSFHHRVHISLHSSELRLQRIKTCR